MGLTISPVNETAQLAALAAVVDIPREVAEKVWGGPIPDISQDRQRAPYFAVIAMLRVELAAAILEAAEKHAEQSCL